ncbi:MAG: protein translocase SEC61 complex subunit gamma [Candidatus Micrarchaeia archaeon]|jgi:protein transport protein SEC61 subunit gamma-like protein
MDVGAMVSDFIGQSERVLNVTHKPKGAEYEHIAKSTALGMAVIGAVGFAISILWHYLRLL